MRGASLLSDVVQEIEESESKKQKKEELSPQKFEKNELLIVKAHEENMSLLMQIKMEKLRNPICLVYTSGVSNFEVYGCGKAKSEDIRARILHR